MSDRDGRGSLCRNLGHGREIGHRLGRGVCLDIGSVGGGYLFLMRKEGEHTVRDFHEKKSIGRFRHQGCGFGLSRSFYLSRGRQRNEEVELLNAI